MKPTDLQLPYQTTGIEWLARKRVALLGDSMGLGKTYQVIKALERLNQRQALVVCPAIARITWKNEFLKWWGGTPLNIQILEKRADVPDLEADIVICSFDYATVSEDKKRLKETKISTPPQNPKLLKWCELNSKPVLVVDESHFLKSLDARRTQAIMGTGAVIHFVSRAWFLTGTPMPNAPDELWPFLKIAGRTTLNYDSFVKLFCNTYPFNGKPVVTGAKRENLPRLRELLEPVMLRRLKKDVLKELPKVMRSEVLVEPDVKAIPENVPPEHLELLKVLQLTDPNEQMQALEVVAKSLPTLRRYCGYQKILPACELIKSELEANAYEKIVIFCIHTQVIKIIAEHLRDFGVVVVHGSVGSAERQKAIESFQSGKMRVFVGNIQAAGTNITLTAASEMAFIEEDYVPGNNEQAIARCDRIGQTLPVNVRFIRLINSIDQKINEILLRKSTDQRLLLGA